MGKEGECNRLLFLLKISSCLHILAMYIFLLVQGHMRRRNVYSTGSFYIYIHRYGLNNNQSRIVLSEKKHRKVSTRIILCIIKFLTGIFRAHDLTSKLFFSLSVIGVL
jgi:hypothetical protein